MYGLEETDISNLMWCMHSKDGGENVTFKNAYEKEILSRYNEWGYRKFQEKVCVIYEFKVIRLLTKMWNFYYNLKPQ